MTSRRGLIRWLPAASLALLGSGVLVLGAYCVAEAFASPGYSLVDAYWRGRLPWMGMAETLIVSGATACVVVGSAVVWWLGGWWRRLLAVPPLLPVTLWWLLAWNPIRGVPCDPCPVLAPDPWAYAYSAPETTALFLIVPALFIVALALTARRRAGASVAT